MRRLAPVALLVWCGCSVLFDPSKAKPTQAGCPTSPAQCPALPNATASCADAVCQYSCVSHFVDANGDLDKAGSDGCELDCTGGQPPENPAELVATVGAAAGRVDWTFPISASAVEKYKLCVTPPMGTEVCVNVDPATQCPMGVCSVSTTGHVDNVRITGVATSVDSCGREGSVSAVATASATPLDTSDPTKWTFESTCTNSTSGAVGDQLSIDQSADTCTSTLEAGDEGWGDLTLDGDFAFGINSKNLAVGLVIHDNSGGYRFSSLSLPVTTTTGGLRRLAVLNQRLPSQADVVVASSVVGALDPGPTHLRLVSHQGVVSLLQGPDADHLVELARFPALKESGKLGIAAKGSGRIEVTHLRASTASAPPSGSPTSVALDFSGGAPASSRLLGSNVTFGPCPVYPAAATCDGGCLPAAGAACAHTVRQGLLDNSTLSFDLPSGIDVRASWHVSMRLALTPDAGTSFPVLLDSEQGALFYAFAGGGWPQDLSASGQHVAPSLDWGVWHDADLRFDADAGSFAVTLDDAPLQISTPVYPPTAWKGPNPGILGLGGGLYLDAYVTDVQVSQP